MIKKILKSKTTIILLVLLFFYLIVNLFFNKKNNISIINQIPTPIPTTNLTPTPVINNLSPKYTPIPEETVRAYYNELDQLTYKDYPLFDSVPYKTNNFLIDYIKPLTLEVILYSNTPEVKQEALNWISSKGVDPKTHTILWKIQP